MCTEFLFLKFKYYLLIFILKCYFFSLPHYALITLMLIPLLFQDTASVNLTIGGSLGQKKYKLFLYKGQLSLSMLMSYFSPKKIISLQIVYIIFNIKIILEFYYLKLG